MDVELALPGDCPPSSAQEPQGAFFRLVSGSLREGEVAGDGDWILPAMKTKGDCAGVTDRCECFAHSLFEDADDLLRAREQIAWARRKAIAEIELTPEMGVIEASPSDLGDSHHEWWPADNQVPQSQVVWEKPE